MRPILEGEAYLARAAEVNTLFSALGIAAPVRPTPEGALAEAVARAADAGVVYLTSFPSRQPTVEERFAVLAGLEAQLLSGGARFAFSTRAEAIHRGEEYTVELAPEIATGAPAMSDRMIVARAVVLAPGRYGAEWLVPT